MKNSLLLACFLCIVSNTFAQTQWEATSASISFAIKNHGSTVHGKFSGISTNIHFSPDKLATSSLKGSVSVGSINTGNDKRDKDLQDPTYFDASSHKFIEMSSTKIVRKGNNYVGTFNVTIKGITKAFEIPFQFTEEGNKASFKSSFSINRREFSVGNKNGLAMFMADDVYVYIDILVKH